MPSKQRGDRFPKLTERERTKFLKILDVSQEYATEQRETARQNVPKDPTPKSNGEVYYFTAFIRSVKWIRSVVTSTSGDGGRKDGKT